MKRAKWLGSKGLDWIVPTVLGALLVWVVQIDNTLTTDVSVDASRFPFAHSGVRLGTGDHVAFEVLPEYSDLWTCGPAPTTADGYQDQRRAEFVRPDAPLCTLVGYVPGDDPGEQAIAYFPIGSRRSWDADRAGVLYLGANDDPNGCGQLATCHAVNARKIVIRIEVRKPWLDLPLLGQFR